MQIGVSAVDGDANVWKKSRAIRQSKIKIVVGNRPSDRVKPGSLHKVHVIACMQLHQSVRTCGHGLRTGPTQGWNKNGHKTNVASRPGSVLGHFHRENPRKCIERRKNMQIGVGAVAGDANVWKKSRAIRRSKIKIVVGNHLFGRPKSGSLHKVHVIACMKLHQSVCTCGHDLRRGPRKV